MYSATVRGSMPNLTGELFRTSAAIDLTYVPYPSTSQALADIMGGRISVIVDSFASLRGAIEGGTVKMLGDNVQSSECPISRMCRLLQK